MFFRKTKLAVAIAERDEAREVAEQLRDDKTDLIAKLCALRIENKDLREKRSLSIISRGKAERELAKLRAERDQLRADLAKFNTRGPGGRFVKRAATDPVRAA